MSVSKRIRQSHWILLAWLYAAVPAGVALAQTGPAFYENFTVEDGLSNYVVTDVLQDQLGFLWIGTQDGLNRYDGYEFRTFEALPGKAGSLSDDYITLLYEDHAARLWIGTQGGGLNVYDPETQHFSMYVLPASDTTSSYSVASMAQMPDSTLLVGIANKVYEVDPHEPVLKLVYTISEEKEVGSGTIRVMVADQKGILWAGTRQGLVHITPESGAITLYTHQPDNPTSLPADIVNALAFDHEHKLWVGTTNGLGIFSEESGRFLKYHEGQLDVTPLNSKVVTSIFFDRDGRTWVGSGSGIFENSSGADKWNHHAYKPGDSSSLASDRVFDIIMDSGGVLWAGTWGGLSKLVPANSKFRSLSHQPGDSNSLTHPRVKTAFEDHGGSLWIGQLMAGLVRYEPSTGAIIRYPYGVEGAEGVISQGIMQMAEDADHRLWIATLGGLDRYDPDSNTFTHWLHDPENRNSLSTNVLQSVLIDSTGVLWFGTYNGGLNSYDPKTDSFTHFMYDPEDTLSISHDHVWPLLETRAGILWVGTFGGGLNRFDRETETFTAYQHDPNDAGSLSGNRVISLAEDTNGTLWVGTMEGGLNAFDPETESFTSFTTEEGLPHNSVAGILPDDRGRLWISTGNGLARFNLETELFDTYDVSDGLPSNVFHFDNAFQGSDGSMYFGNAEGLVIFHPDSVDGNPHIPPVVITAINVFNVPAPLEASAEQLTEVTFPYNQNFLSFEFAALDFTVPSQNRYVYKMEGLDPEWVEAGDRRYASFPNLAPGEYTLRVKASNNDGVWNEEGASLAVIVTPPIWKTPLAYLLYALATVAAIFVIDRTRKNRIIQHERAHAQVVEMELRAEAAEYESRALKAEYERQEAELSKAREIEEAHQALSESHEELRETHEDLKVTQERLIHAEKMASLGELTAGIAHEIKNPLNFINNFAVLNVDLATELRERLVEVMKEAPAEIRDLLEDLALNAQHIARHGRRADSIVKGMMQHATTVGGFREPTVINTLVEKYSAMAYEELDQEKRKRITMETSLDPGLGALDLVPGEVGQVVMNLLQNAFHAVEERADQEPDYIPEIHIKTERQYGSALIKIVDNGIGIAEDQVKRVFEPFFTTKPTGEGHTGLGLSLSYDIVTRGHGGTLEFESNATEGTTFTVSLPIEAS